MVKKLTNEQVAILVDLYDKGESIKLLADTYGVSHQAVWGLLKRRNRPMLSKSECSRRYKLNEDAFATITEESAYWVGFLMADGTIATRGDALILSLSSRDKNHLAKFKKFLDSDAEIQLCAPTKGQWAGSQPQSKLAVYSKKLIQSLAVYGLVSQKTFRERVLNLESNRHFWRGYVDGDGSIKALEQPFLEVVGGQEILTQFLAFLQSHNIGNNLTVRVHKSIFRVGCSWSTARETIKLLYSDCSISLDRKMELAKRWL